MQPYTVHRSACSKWTSAPVHYGGREYRRVRYANGVRVTFAVIEHITPSRMRATLISRRRP